MERLPASDTESIFLGEKIFEKGYSTKKEKKDNHGLGLWTVRKILNQTDNLSLFTKAGELFSQQLEIYEQKVNI